MAVTKIIFKLYWNVTAFMLSIQQDNNMHTQKI